MSVRNGTSIADDVRAICVVVDDVVDDSSGRDGALNGVEEADELLVAMPPHARPITVPSRMLSAANRGVVRVRL
jgi:hypothetical protein